MRSSEKSGLSRNWVFTVVGLISALVMLALCVNAHRSQRLPQDLHRKNAFQNGSVPTTAAAFAPASTGTRDQFKVRRYIMDFDGDHSLDVATVIEQGLAGSTKYTVQLQLASGAEQSVVVNAPPGGLQIEMHDMTGDHVPNDLVLKPALLQWLPTVLVNDGHDHFEVAVSGTDPDSLSSRQDLGSPGRDYQTFAVLISSGFRAITHPIREALFDSRYQQGLLSDFTQPAPKRFGHASSSGRAPPLVTLI
jgi:hypothetical protein